MIGVLVLIFDAAAIIDVVTRKMDGGKKILWIVLILAIPVIGMGLYFLLGRE